MSAAYRQECVDAFWDVFNGLKPLMIVSEGKSTAAYEATAAWADRLEGMHCELAMFVCEDGELHEHVFVCREGAPYAREAIEAIFDAVEEFPTLSRKALQLKLGLLLGYSAAQVIEFTKSVLGKTCKCDCCGGAESVKPLDRDAQIARTMFYA